MVNSHCVSFRMTGNSKSEDGDEHPKPTDENSANPTSQVPDALLALIESQNQNFLKLLNAISSQPVKAGPSNITLPEFDPEKKDNDPRAWCNTANICLSDSNVEGAQLLNILSRALKGNASRWLSQVSFPGMTWKQFHDLFIAQYDSTEPPAATVLDVLNGKPKEGECLAAYAGRVLSTLSNNWQKMNANEIAVSVTLAHVAQIDNRAQRLAFTSKIDSRDSLLNELKAITFRKRPFNGGYDSGENKRPRMNFPRCGICHRTNHKMEDCFYRNKSAATTSETKTQTTPTAGAPNSQITCFICKQPGHIAIYCKNAKKENPGGSQVRRVDFCAINPIGRLVHDGESYNFTFDSGSECSLLKESISNKFSGPRFYDPVCMTGIGKSKVESLYQVLSKVCIDDITMEVLFHVLPSQYLSNDIMIGREVLVNGMSVSLNADQCSFVASPMVKVVNECGNSSSKNGLTVDQVRTDLEGEEKSKLFSILTEFADSFADGYPRTRVQTGQMEIRLIDPSLTVQRRPHRLGPADREIVRGIIQELESAGIIRPSHSPFSSPVLLVPKKNGSYRMCVDYRELNSNTVPDRFPLPLISDLIARLGGSIFFSCLDMASGFHQIPVHPDSIEKTAFVTPDGQWEYLAVPFGLRNAPSVYQRSVLNALGDLAHTFVVSYMDDLVIISRTAEEGLERLHMVLSVLTSKGFSLNLSKCSFIVKRILFLGYDIFAGQVKPNPGKVEALTLLPPPHTVTELRGFIGLASYFRQFIRGFSEIMAPLFALTRLTGCIDWLPEHENVRQQIIGRLTSEPILIIFDPSYPIELHTDASSAGFGGMLLHRIDGKPRVVAYYSRRTTPDEAKYISYDLETLAVKRSVQNFLQYLQGRKFTVVTDCNALKQSRKKVDLSPRVYRWWAYLQAFDFDVVHREGSRMLHVDYLSRYPLGISSRTVSEVDDGNPGHKKIEVKQIDWTELPNNWLHAEQLRDEEISALVSKFNEDSLNEDIRNTYELRSGILYRKIQRNGRTRCLPIIPRAFRWSVINNVHESIMHLGWDKTLEKVYEHYWFEKMSKYVRKFVESCITCRVSKADSGKVQAELHPIPKVSTPWHTVHVDATGKLSGKNDTKEYALVFIDSFTKYVLLHHSFHINSESTIKALKSCVSLFGSPTRIIADQGRCFSSKEFKDFCESHNIQLHLIATGSSRANGQVERVMSTLKNMLTAVETKNERSWQEALGDVQLAMNCTVNRVTKISPLEMMFGNVGKPLGLVSTVEHEERIDLPEARQQALDRINKSSAYDKERFDKTKAKLSKLLVGDLALIKNEERNQTKLAPKFRGPFKVIDVLDGDRYLLKSLNSNRTYKYAHDQVRKVPELIDPIDLDDNASLGSETNNDEDNGNNEGVDTNYEIFID